MTYNELRYALAMFNKWRSTNPEKYEKISAYLGTKGKCLSFFEYNVNEIIKKHYGEYQWNEIYRQTASAMTDFLDACDMFKDLGAEKYIASMVKSIPYTVTCSFDSDVSSIDNSSVLEGLK